MKAKTKKKSTWPEIPRLHRCMFYVAHWPSPDTNEYRVNLHRKFLRAYRRNRNVNEARKEIRSETLYNLRVLAYRVTMVFRLLSFIAR